MRGIRTGLRGAIVTTHHQAETKHGEVVSPSGLSAPVSAAGEPGVSFGVARLSESSELKRSQKVPLRGCGAKKFQIACEPT